MANAVIKRGNNFYLGTLELNFKKIAGKIVFNGYTWGSSETVNKLADVKEATSFVTIKKWLKQNDYNDVIAEEVLKRCGMQSIYMLDRPLNPTTKEFESYWWKDINKLCVHCEKTCKQSSKVTIMNCAQRKVEKSWKQ